MLEWDAEIAAGDTQPSPAGKEPVTKGGNPPTSHRGSPQNPSQWVPGPATSAGTPSQPRQQPGPSAPHHRCNKAFSYRSKLAIIGCHMVASPPSMPQSPQGLLLRSKLAAQGNMHHHTDAHPYPCPHCPKAFSFPSKLATQSLCHDPYGTRQPGHSGPSLLQAAPRPLAKDVFCSFINVASIRLTARGSTSEPSP